MTTAVVYTKELHYIKALLQLRIVFFFVNCKCSLKNSKIRNPGRDISCPIFIRKEIETRTLERKSKQKISRLIDLNRLNDIISR